MFSNNGRRLNSTTTVVETVSDRHSTSNNSVRRSLNSDIIYAIATNNLNDIIQSINPSNVNNIIDTETRMTALHYATRNSSNIQIIKYLMECGADHELKDSNQKDCIDLAIKSNERFLVDWIMQNKFKKSDLLISDLKSNVETLKIKNRDQQETINYLESKNTELSSKCDLLTMQVNQNKLQLDEAKAETGKYKRKFEDSDKAFTNLLNKRGRKDP
jgi:hypothetical protein